MMRGFRRLIAIGPIVVFSAASVPVLAEVPASGVWIPATVPNSPTSIRQVLPPAGYDTRALGASTFDDEDWWDGFALPVANGFVSCAVPYEAGIVIGGRFTAIGHVIANNIAYWDGSQWNPLGQGTDGNVLTLALYGSNIVAGGTFSRAGDADAANVAEWNGSSWSALSEGLDDPVVTPSRVITLAKYGDTLVAGGRFTRSGSTRLRNLAAWDGSKWVDLGGGVDGSVEALAVRDPALFVGGVFDSAGVVPASGIAQWTGSWSPLGDGLSADGGPGEVRAITLWGDSLLAGGTFTSSGPVSTPNVSVWNGTTWAPLNSGPGGAIYALTVHDGTPYAAGGLPDGGYATWNGSSWDQGEPWTTISIMSFLDAGPDLIATGLFGAYNGISPGAFNVARLHGGRWDPLEKWGPQMYGLLAGYGGAGQITALAVYRGELVASGYFTYAGNSGGWSEIRDLARWNGESWHPFPQMPGGGLVDCMLADGDTLFVGGTFTEYGPGPGFRNVPVYRFDGTTWAALDTLTTRVGNLARYHGDLYLAADATWGQPGVTGVYRWTGSRWDPAGPLPDSPDAYGVASLVVYEDRLVAGGHFPAIGSVPAANIASWDGSHWEAIGAGVPGPPGISISVNALAVHDSRLIVGHVHGVSAWDGTSWNSVGVGPVYNIMRLASIGGELFAGGYLWWIHDPPRDDGVARWDGTKWQPLGTGTNAPVSSFAELGSHLYVGGYFNQAGGRGSFGVARWEHLAPPPPASPPPTAFLSPASPNPFRTSTRIDFQLDQPGRVRITVFDLAGREMRVLEDGGLAAGGHETDWDGRDRTGRLLGAGIYFIRIQHPDGKVQSRKVVRLR